MAVCRPPRMSLFHPLWVIHLAAYLDTFSFYPPFSTWFSLIAASAGCVGGFLSFFCCCCCCFSPSCAPCGLLHRRQYVNDEMATQESFYQVAGISGRCGRVLRPGCKGLVARCPASLPRPSPHHSLSLSLSLSLSVCVSVVKTRRWFILFRVHLTGRFVMMCGYDHSQCRVSIFSTKFLFDMWDMRTISLEWFQ